MRFKTISFLPLTLTLLAVAASAQQNSSRPSTAGLPYELAQAVQKYPVTLYTSRDCGAPCNDGRNLLTRRGIPFIEKTVDSNDDITALKKITNSQTVPLLTIGGQQLSGFQNNNWSQYLSAAGYPANSQLPSTYQHPPATPLATPRPVAATPAPAASSPDVSDAPIPVSPPPDPSNPAGIRF